MSKLNKKLLFKKPLSTLIRCTALASAVLALAAGCPAREVAQVLPRQNKEQQKTVPVNINRNIDILFVVDNSGSMAEEQRSLTTNFINFINVLRNIEGGLPNVHIGVISTDLGGSQTDPACSTSDEGTLVTHPSITTGNFIVDKEDDNGGRTTNYTGNLEDAFSDLASLGTSGCGFEQPLRAMQTALLSPTNVGFVRPNAFLAVIFITDEDDCSVNNNEMFSADCNTIDNCDLGPLTSYRCFNFGVQCEVDRPRMPGPRQTDTCSPRANSAYMPTPKEYANFLKNFKAQESLVITAGIIAPPEETILVERVPRMAPGRPRLPDALVLKPSCVTPSGEGFPAIRLTSFFNEFPTRSTVTTICNEDLTDALVQVADLLARLVGNPCLEGAIQTDPLDCTVEDVSYADTEREERQPAMPRCSDQENLDDQLNTSTNKPCYILAIDDIECDTSTHLKLVVIRESEPDVPFGTLSTQISCAAN